MTIFKRCPGTPARHATMALLQFSIWNFAKKRENSHGWGMSGRGILKKPRWKPPNNYLASKQGKPDVSATICCLRLRCAFAHAELGGVNSFEVCSLVWKVRQQTQHVVEQSKSVTWQPDNASRWLRHLASIRLLWCATNHQAVFARPPIFVPFGDNSFRGSRNTEPWKIASIEYKAQWQKWNLPKLYMKDFANMPDGSDTPRLHDKIKTMNTFVANRDLDKVLFDWALKEESL